MADEPRIAAPDPRRRHRERGDHVKLVERQIMRNKANSGGSARWARGPVGQTNPTCRVQQRGRDASANKQSQFCRLRQEGQLLGGKRVMTHGTRGGLRPNKANFGTTQPTAFPGRLTKQSQLGRSGRPQDPLYEQTQFPEPIGRLAIPGSAGTRNTPVFHYSIISALCFCQGPAAAKMGPFPVAFGGEHSRWIQSATGSANRS